MPVVVVELTAFARLLGRAMTALSMSLYRQEQRLEASTRLLQLWPSKMLISQEIKPPFRFGPRRELTRRITK